MADAAALTANAMSDDPVTRFAASPVERRKLLVERIAGTILGIVTCALVVPLVGIMAILLVKAMPMLSWAFLTQNPQNYMTAGGIWAPRVGTL
jgi:ABC-type phosphate transport system permease subunit